MDKFDLRPFPDVPEGHWLRAPVEALHAKGYKTVEVDTPLYPSTYLAPNSGTTTAYVPTATCRLRAWPAPSAWRMERVDDRLWVPVPDGWTELIFSSDTQVMPWVEAVADTGEVYRRMLTGPPWPRWDRVIVTDWRRTWYERHLRDWVAANGWDWDTLTRRYWG